MWPITVTFSYCIRVHWFIYFVFTYTVLLTVYYIQLNNFVRENQGGGLTSEGYIYGWSCCPPHTTLCGLRKEEGGGGVSPPAIYFQRDGGHAPAVSCYITHTYLWNQNKNLRHFNLFVYTSHNLYTFRIVHSHQTRTLIGLLFHCQLYKTQIICFICPPPPFTQEG